MVLVGSEVLVHQKENRTWHLVLSVQFLAIFTGLILNKTNLPMRSSVICSDSCSAILPFGSIVVDALLTGHKPDGV